MIALGLVLLVCLVIAINVWWWRDMRQRDRPPWLRVTVLALAFICLPVGLFVWMADLSRHPHDPNVSRWDQVRQRYQEPTVL